MSRRQNPRDAQNCRIKTKNLKYQGVFQNSKQTENGKNPMFRAFFFHPDYTVGLGVSPNHAFAKRRPLAGCTAGRELHPALKNPDIRLCKAVYRFAQIKYIPVCCIMQAFFHSSSQTVKRQGRPKPSPPWEEYKRKEKDRSSITGNSIAQRREIQSKRKSNLCKKMTAFALPEPVHVMQKNACGTGTDMI